MMSYREQLEGGYRFLKVRRIKSFALALMAIVIVLVSAILLFLAGPRLNPFYLPLTAFLLFVVALLLLATVMNFGFRTMEIRAARMDSQRYLVAQSSRANAWWVVGIAMFCLVVLVVLTQSGFVTATLSQSESSRSIAPFGLYSVTGDSGNGWPTRDALGFTEATELRVRVFNGTVRVDVSDLTDPRSPLRETQLLTGDMYHNFTLGPGYQRIILNFTNVLNGNARVSWTLVVRPMPDLAVNIPALLLGFVVSNIAWAFYLEPIRKKYQGSSIYSLDYKEATAAGEESYQDYQTRTAPVKPAAGAEVRPGVFATDRPCPSCGKALVFVQKWGKHYCLHEKKYPDAPKPRPGGPAPAPTPARVLPLAPPTAPAVPAPKPVVRNPCPTCGRELKWVEKYARFYCAIEQKYAAKDYAAPSAAPLEPAPAPPPEPAPPVPAPPVPVSQTPVIVADIRPVPIAPRADAPMETVLREASDAYRDGDFPKAIGLFDRILAEDPQHVQALLSKGAALMKTGRRLDALAAFEKVLSVDEQNERALQIRAVILETEGRWRDAVEAFDAYLAVKPADAEYIAKKAEALLSLGRREDALATLEKALAMSPRDARIRGRIDELRFDVAAALSRALLASAGGNYSQAVSLFDQVLVREPTNVNALMGKAVALRRSGDLEGAMACVRHVLAATPNHPAALLNLGRILEEQGKPQEALGAYQELLQANPQDAEGWERQGELLHRDGKTVEALFSFKQALKARGADVSLQERIQALEAALPRPGEAVPPSASPVEDAVALPPEAAQPEELPAGEEAPGPVIVEAVPAPEEIPATVVPEAPDGKGAPEEVPVPAVPSPPEATPEGTGREETGESTGEAPEDGAVDALTAELGRIKGVGPARIKALLKAGYTTLEKVRAASEEDLAGVKGLSKKVAKAIREHLAG